MGVLCETSFPLRIPATLVGFVSDTTMSMLRIVLFVLFGLAVVFVNIKASKVLETTIYVNEGNSFVMPCRNDTPGIFYALVWQVSNGRFKSSVFEYFADTGYRVQESIDSRSDLVKETSLKIDRAEATDSRVYECNIIFFYEGRHQARLKSVINVVVSVPPKITTLTPVTQTRSLAERPIITCNVNATPSANITWSRVDGKPIRGKIMTTGLVSVLKLKRLRLTDTANYTCTAENRAGKVEKSVFVKVKAIPEIVSLSAPRIDVDTNGKLTCRATGYPVPLVEWIIPLDNGDVITVTSGKSYQQKYRATETRIDNENEWAEVSLFINSVRVSDWKKNYTCLAANSEGSTIKKINITGHDKPGRPAIELVKMYVDKAIVEWNVPADGGSKILAYVVEYKGKGESVWLSREIRPANVVKFVIMHLRPSTIYSFRIYAKNSVGMSEISDIYTTNTKARPVTQPAPTSAMQSSAKKDKSAAISSYGLTTLIGIIAGVFLGIVLVVFLVFCLPPDSRRPSAMPSETAETIPLMSRVDQWEFPRDRLRLSTVLGTGAFGMVMRGDALGIRGSLGRVKCAVKMVKDSDNECARKDLYAELDMLKLLPEHPNVVSLLGCCTRSEPLMIIVEYCTHGDLQGFLRNSRGISERYYSATYGDSPRPKVTAKMLLTFAWQIATGMQHLATFKVIHRDLAARNILVDENLICKISDFGFARDIYVEEQYLKKSQGGRFPIKWMAIESLLDGISTSKSDVWSFAVVMWEIVTLGASPYPGMNSYEVVSFLQDGYRMDKPKHCSDEVYSVLMDCWHIAPQRRPTFQEIADRLKLLIDNDDQEFINMNFYQDHLYVNFDVNLASQSSNNASAQELSMTDSTPLTTATAAC
eukprot:gene3560-4064_t